MTTDEIRELIQLVSETQIAELEVQRGENRVRIRRSMGPEAIQYSPMYYQTPPSGPVANPAIAPDPAASMPTPVSAPAAPKKPADDPAVKLVKSPIVGTFYASASPTLAPFVQVGEAVQPGRVLCIIESMKLMNEIEAEFAGVIESQLVANGQPVEYGEALFAIRAVS